MDNTMETPTSISDTAALFFPNNSILLQHCLLGTELGSISHPSLSHIHTHTQSRWHHHTQRHFSLWFFTTGWPYVTSADDLESFRAAGWSAQTQPLIRFYPGPVHILLHVGVHCGDELQSSLHWSLISINAIQAMDDLLSQLISQRLIS